LDLLVEEKIIVEIKAVETLLPIHEAQALTYLKLTGLTTILLINFNVPVLRTGLRRLTKKSLPNFPPSCDPIG
jgi:GxxExxY protein